MVAEDLSHGTRQQAVSAVAFLPAEAQILVWGPPAYVTGPSGAIGIPRCDASHNRPPTPPGDLNLA